MNETQYPEKTAAEIKADIQAHVKKCNEKAWIHFAPNDGVCYACRKNIYQNYGSRKGHNGTDYITGCPHCHESYCE